MIPHSTSFPVFENMDISNSFLYDYLQRQETMLTRLVPHSIQKICPDMLFRSLIFPCSVYYHLCMISDRSSRVAFSLLILYDLNVKNSRGTAFKFDYASQELNLFRPLITSKSMNRIQTQPDRYDECLHHKETLTKSRLPQRYVKSRCVPTDQ